MIPSSPGGQWAGHLRIDREWRLRDGVPDPEWDDCAAGILVEDCESPVPTRCGARSAPRDAGKRIYRTAMTSYARPTVWSNSLAARFSWTPTRRPSRTASGPCARGFSSPSGSAARPSATRLRRVHSGRGLPDGSRAVRLVVRVLPALAGGRRADDGRPDRSLVARGVRSHMAASRAHVVNGRSAGPPRCARGVESPRTLFRLGREADTERD